MQASEANLFQFLEGKKQFIIPIYQRTYSWGVKHCQQLWDDILRVHNEPMIPAHFIGSIVYVQEGIYRSTRVSQLLVIDGQQRLTTLSLLLAAIAEAAEDEDTKDGIRDDYLINTRRADEKYKLLLTRNDNETYRNLLENREVPSDYSPRIMENYQFFQDRLRESDLTLDEVMDSLGKLVVVDVSLDKTHDNPQLIFESLNSTGLDLSQSDLIRNFVLMGLDTDEQEELYLNHWLPMEQRFGHTDYTRNFDRFMRDYLTLKNAGTIPNIQKVYAEFKRYVGINRLPIPEIVKDIERYSKYWVRITLPRRNENDGEIRKLLVDINSLKVTVSYPFLLEVYNDYDQEVLSREDFLDILRLVQTYSFRRAICGIPTNSLNKTFANLSKEIQKSNYLASAMAAFANKSANRRMPSDEEFCRELVVKDVYHFTSRNFLLSKLENHGRKEIVDISDWTIEHILPQNQNLSDEWKAELGNLWEEVREKYLHTIGNLTLTGYNSELSDRPFAEKRDIEGGFRDSPIRLNRELKNLDCWNEQGIIARANKLAEKATVIWPYPIISTQETEPAGTEEFAYEDYSDRLSNELRELSEAFRNQILNLDASVEEEYRSQSLIYKSIDDFVSVVPQQGELILYLNIPSDEIDDPKGLCEDVSRISHPGIGDLKVILPSRTSLGDILDLVHQSFEYQAEDTSV